MALRVLGPLELVHERRSLKIGGPREHVVLAVLALKVNRVVSVDQLVTAVWGDAPPSTARGQVQGCISTLRKLFGDAGRPEAIRTRPSGYELALPVEELDSQEFARLVTHAQALAAEHRTAEAAAALRAALDLWRGPALGGTPSDVVARGASVLEGARLSAVEEHSRMQLELGRHEEAIADLRELLVEHPLRERLYGFLMLALYRSGRQVEALEVCRHARATLVEELGIEPCSELRELERAVLNRDPALDLPAVPEPPPVAGVPAADDGSACPRHLPPSIGDFVGRAEELEGIRGAVAGLPGDAPAFAAPILAISGPDGIGKSVLALRVAHELAGSYPDGHLYADRSAAGPEAPYVLSGRFLRALGVPAAAVPEDAHERAELYRNRLAGKRLLLVLEDVAAEDDVLPLLPGTASCVVVVTSRQRLVGLCGAHRVDLAPFADADAEELLGRIVGPHRLSAEPEATAELLGYCDGLPLALRIAGARLAARPRWRVAELVRRLRDQRRRLDELSHHGLDLRSVLDEGYRALPATARRLLRLMSLVEAPSLPAWTAAALLDVPLAEAEDVLEHLVDAQVLDSVPGPWGWVRYRLPELTRVYAGERLADVEGEPERRAALGRVLGCWLSLAEKAHRQEYGGDHTVVHGPAPRWELPEWVDEGLVEDPMAWLDHEREGLVAAVRQAAAEGMDELAWDLALTAVTVFEVKGHLDDWRATTELAHEACRRAGNRLGCAAMLYSLGALHLARKRIPDAAEAFEGALALFEQAGHAHGQALVLRHAALLDRLQGDSTSMWARSVDALARMRSVGDPIGEANVLRGMAKACLDDGDLDEARSMLQQALDLCRRAGYRRGEVQVVSRFAELHLKAGETVLARRSLQQVLDTTTAMGDRVGTAHALHGLGLVRFREGRLDSAVATLLHAAETAAAAGDRMIEGQSRYALGSIGVARGDTAAAGVHLDAACSLFTEAASAIWQAKALILRSEVHDASGRIDRSDDDLRTALALLAELDSAEARALVRQLDGAVAGAVREDVPAPREPWGVRGGGGTAGRRAPRRPVLDQPPVATREGRQSQGESIAR